MPVLFVGHGSPEVVLQENAFTRMLSRLGQSLPTPTAVMVVSAHWLTDGTYAGCMKKPRTIHDFYGFPREMYRITYPCPGSPRYGRLVGKIVKTTVVHADSTWGLDHASWAILRFMYPRADVPVFELSLDYSPYNAWRPKPLRYHYELAGELSQLRDKGVLIIGSGNIVHNLGLMEGNVDSQPSGWAVEFDEKVKAALMRRDHDALIEYRRMGEAALLSVPTLDHYLPIIYAVGLQRSDEPLAFLYEGYQYCSISMRAFRIG